MGKEITRTAGKPPRTDKNNKTVPSAEKWTKPGDMRKTYIVNTITANEIEAIAFYEGSKIKDIVNAALTEYVAKWKNENGELRLPKK